MRFSGLCPALAATALLCGCADAPDGGSPPVRHGRFAGIGTYPADQLWSRMVAAGKPADKEAATIADDSQIIVVVDSLTGEVRQCGNLSGHCIGMNPWTGARAATQAAPVKLTAHAADLAREAEDGANADPIDDATVRASKPKS